MLPQDFIFEYDQTLFALLEKKNIKYNPETLHEIWTKHVLDLECSEAIQSRLLLFNMNDLQRGDRRQMEDFLHDHLMRHNSNLDEDEDHAILPGSIFTYPELEDCWESQDCGFDDSALVEGLQNWDTFNS
ncbi:hypothetical protein ACJ73_08614 [Blastomyces percursus]|uniref:Uncharacterized protein n=1 Tax=Blastomyces percursus TaxID=1658174 RepID=A0A1J9QWX4_9EURO|nr:hypothetical protein ACJ73_08614 [Blastomyces percursus]